MKTVINYTTMNGIQTNSHAWLSSSSLFRVLRDITSLGGVNQYNIYYTTDDGQEGFWQNYGPI
ncbi:MAG: hypothetical protein H7296_11415 [Bacteroidia bacterium]|nr:hypothetical protein [Bacteroidia bacterium]